MPWPIFRQWGPRTLQSPSNAIGAAATEAKFDQATAPDGAGNHPTPASLNCRFLTTFWTKTLVFAKKPPFSTYSSAEKGFESGEKTYFSGDQSFFSTDKTIFSTDKTIFSTD